MSTRTNLADNEAVQFSYLSDSQKARLFNEMVDTLQFTGVNLHHEAARYLLWDNGCDVEGDRVYIAPRLIRQALSTVPPITVIHHWDGSGQIRLEQGRTYYGPGPTCPYFLDPETLEKRKYVQSDPGIVARTCDALPEFGYVMSLGSISDVGQGMEELYEFSAMIQNTAKPIMAWSFSKETCRDIHHMAIAMAGGPINFRRKPNFIYYGEPISPLVNDFHAIDKLMYCAEHRIPQVYTPASIGGATVPATHAAQLVCAMAESMVGVIISQLINPGTCICMGGAQSIMDMRYMVFAYGAPELSILCASLTEMIHYMGLPMFSTAGATDSKAMDLQAAIEPTISIHSAMLSDANLVHDVGFLESAMTGSIFQLVLTNEAIGMSRRISHGIEVNSDSMAVDEICSVGPEGDFSQLDHTKRWSEKYWKSDLLDRKSYEDWKASGGTTFQDRIIKRTQEIVKNHEPPEVKKEVKEEIDAIMARAEERISRKRAKA